MLPAPRKIDIVAGLGLRAHNLRNLCGLAECERLAMTVRFDRRDERVAIGALDRRLAGGVDIRDDHRIGIVEAGREFIEQRMSRV